MPSGPDAILPIFSVLPFQRRALCVLLDGDGGEMQPWRSPKKAISRFVLPTCPPDLCWDMPDLIDLFACILPVGPAFSSYAGTILALVSSPSLWGC